MTSLVEKICASLWQDAREGNLRPDTVLDEKMLAARFGVSRTPVREAVNHLCGQGLVVPSPRGFMVPKLSVKELRELLECLGELEAACAKHAARRSTPAECAALKVALEKCEAAYADDDSDAYAAANDLFHLEISRAAHNRHLSEQLRLMEDRCSLYRPFRFERRSRIERSIQDHRLIFRAIEAQDGNAAYLAMAKHAAAGGEDFAELVVSLPDDLYA